MPKRKPSDAKGGKRKASKPSSVDLPEGIDNRLSQLLARTISENKTVLNELLEFVLNSADGHTHNLDGTEGDKDTGCRGFGAGTTPGPSFHSDINTNVTEETAQVKQSLLDSSHQMSQHPDYIQTVSLKLSEVLNDIGVNERMVQKRRRMVLLGETMWTSACRLVNSSIYRFGSRSEGSTTTGLPSDSYILKCDNSFNVIQDWSEWQPGIQNLLMVQDETTTPGYCLLQKLRDDKPLPLPTAFLEHLPDRYLTVREGKVLLKNTIFRDQVQPGGVFGLAQSKQGQPGIADQDYVSAFHCKSWPVEARPWLVRQGIGRWPTEDWKRYCETTGCFLLPVGSKSGLNEELEWRISTFQAERCLMYNLTITQQRCYILLKMILKTFINPKCDGVLSSYMCKNVLLHCIENTYSNYWQPSNILACLIYCLIVLQNFVRQENCPHFIISENNLMAGKIYPHNKYILLEILHNIIQNGGRALLEIPIDDLGARLQRKINMDETFLYYQTPAEVCAQISTDVLLNIATDVINSHGFILSVVTQEGTETLHERLSDFVFTLTRSYREMKCNSLEKSVCSLLTPPLCSTLASVIASHDIETTGSIYIETLNWFLAGLYSDVSSGRLKLASAFYCIGHMEHAEVVLRMLKEEYILSVVEPICECYRKSLMSPKQGFVEKCNTGNEELIKDITAFCVRFLRCEINCVPVELQYEMYRSTQEDIIERHETSDCWMDWAVVDSLPYIFFLQYKIYGALHRTADQQCALENLVATTDTEINLRHRETVLNLLGQCMEQEKRYTDALRCYMRSLNIRRRNNAARFLICILLNVLVHKE